jgi:aminopeptidase N
VSGCSSCSPGSTPRPRSASSSHCWPGCSRRCPPTPTRPGRRAAGRCWPTRRWPRCGPRTRAASRTLAAAARGEEHVAALRGLLDGSLVIKGLAVDTDARWAFLQGLVAVGAAGDPEIDAEAARDATATGARRAATARALRPTPESKKETWDRAFNDESIPNAVHEAMVAGFWHPAQQELTAPYVERYFADIRGLWERRPGEIAKNAVEYLFPKIVEEGTLEAADRWLGGHQDAPAPLRRLVSEGRDGIARGLWARQRDAAASS